MRKKVVIDELDKEILNILSFDRKVQEILYGLDINHSTWLYHKNRLIKLKLIDKENKGTFRIFRLTQRGKELIKWING